MNQRDLKARTFEFALNVTKLIPQLPNSVWNRIYFSQLIRSSSSVGINYRASQRAKSDRDFINKLKIVDEEADECIYFLELLLVLNKDYSHLIVPLVNEGTEILKMIVASINTKRVRMADQKKI
ncbi:MAG TPA: four helix bundle protein [Flavisolibacter sp.]|nr:four helix bundle protein [Flavisolibacter sp.]